MNVVKFPNGIEVLTEGVTEEKPAVAILARAKEPLSQSAVRCLSERWKDAVAGTALEKVPFILLPAGIELHVIYKPVKVEATCQAVPGEPVDGFATYTAGDKALEVVAEQEPAFSND